MYLGDEGSGEEEHDEQREEYTPWMYGMDNGCQGRNNDADWCDGFLGVRAVHET